MADDDSAMLHNRAMIINNLSMLVKQKCMIRADLGGKESALTAIVAINHKEGTLVLDYCSSDYLNRKLMTTPNVHFSTGFNGIQVNFTGDKITLTKYEGAPAFSMPIPSSLFWYNRREYYRINTPMMNPSICEVVLASPKQDSTKEYIEAYNNPAIMSAIRQQSLAKIQKELSLKKQRFIEAYAKMSIENKIKAKREQAQEQQEENSKVKTDSAVPDERLLDVIISELYDISLSGFSITNSSEEASSFLIPGAIYENCVLTMPGNGKVTATLKIMMKRTIEARKITAGFSELVGIKFIDLKQTEESMVLRYIQDVERQSGVLNI